MASTYNRKSSGSTGPTVAHSSSSSKRQAMKIQSSGNALNSGSKPGINININNKKKRPPLSNLTNLNNPSLSSSLVPCATTRSTQAKKGYPTNFSRTKPVLHPRKSNAVVPSKTPVPHSSAVSAPSKMDVSPSPSYADSISIDSSMSACESFKSPEIEYLDGSEVATHSIIQRKMTENLHIDDHVEMAGNNCKVEILSEMNVVEVINVDDQYMDPQFCTTIACDIYKHIRVSEILKRPSTDFIEKIQKDIDANMRGILIDWLVEVSEEYRLVPDTLYLTVNYVDRYLSGNSVNRHLLQLLGVTCMMIAAKYEEICAPEVEEYCYITDNSYFKEEILEMEAKVLNSLKFEMTAPTTKCFLRRFIHAAQVTSEVSSMQLECMSNYVAELSLLEYGMLQYAPSLIAASSVFLAKYILTPSRKPWNSTLLHYTLYQPSDLHDCVKALHQLCLSSSLPAIREKYSQHKFKFVAKKYCPPSIPSEYFLKTSC